MSHFKTLLVVVALALPLSGCLGFRMPGGTGIDETLACDTLGADADAQKIEAFIETSQRFEADTLALSAEVEATCEAFASDLGITPPSAEGRQLQVEASCVAVRDEIESIFAEASAAESTFVVTHEAPSCAVDVDAYAGCVAECDVTVDVTSDITCEEGRLVGECSGVCVGECRVDGTVTEVNGACAGTCAGSCDIEYVEPRCEGELSANADAQCEASCEARVDVVAVCTEPSLEISYDSGLTPETQARLDTLAYAMERNYPRLLSLTAQLETAASSGAEMVASFEGAASAAGRVGMRAGACFADATYLAADSMATISVTLEVSVEVSASASASASAG